mgnify:CR=1 FL=1
MSRPTKLFYGIKGLLFFANLPNVTFFASEGSKDNMREDDPVFGPDVH